MKSKCLVACYRGIKALEVGCGKGQLFLRFAALFPHSHFTLTNLTPEPLEEARQQAAQRGLTNVSFQLLDLYQMADDLTEAFDWLLSCYVIHDLPHPGEALANIQNSLKPGGHFSLVDFFVSSYVAENVKNHKGAAALYSLGTFNCIPLSYQQLDSEALGPCLGIENMSQFVHAAGMTVLGLQELETSDCSAMCMCQKPGGTLR